MPRTGPFCEFNAEDAEGIQNTQKNPEVLLRLWLFFCVFCVEDLKQDVRPPERAPLTR